MSEVTLHGSVGLLVTVGTAAWLCCSWGIANVSVVKQWWSVAANAARPWHWYKHRNSMDEQESVGACIFLGWWCSLCREWTPEVRREHKAGHQEGCDGSAEVGMRVPGRAGVTFWGTHPTLLCGPKTTVHIAVYCVCVCFWQLEIPSKRFVSRCLSLSMPLPNVSSVSVGGSYPASLKASECGWKCLFVRAIPGVSIWSQLPLALWDVSNAHLSLCKGPGCICCMPDPRHSC